MRSKKPTGLSMNKGPRVSMGHGEHPEAWAAQAENSPVSELGGVAKGLRKDWAAVTAGLTVPYSSGPEGHVNRIKMIKRQMCGRASPDLLRKRVLLAE
jgi:transposase